MLLHATVSFDKVIHFCITTLFATHLELMFTHTPCIMKIEECWLCAVVRGI